VPASFLAAAAVPALWLVSWTVERRLHFLLQQELQIWTAVPDGAQVGLAKTIH
jgi:hypothetical protein